MRTRASERGTAMIVMMIVLVGLGTIAGLTVISVQGGSATTNNARFNSIAVYAAESGAAAAMDFLRKNTAIPTATPPFLSAYVRPSNNNVNPEPLIAGNDIQPGVAGNLLSLDQQSWYTVRVFNNVADTGFNPGRDDDGIVILHITGHGPNGAVAELEWEVKTDGDTTHTLTILGWRQVL